MDSSLPKQQPFARWHLKSLFIVLIILALLIGSAINTQAGAEFSWDQFGALWVKMAQPDWTYFSAIVGPILQTIQMAIVGTVLGAIISVPFALLAASNIIKSRIIRQVVRFFLNLVRALPDLLLAALFVAVVGIGPMAGVGALTIFSFGMMSKLFYEAIETIDEGPIEALTAAGANSWQVIVFAIMPQVLNSFTSYFLYTLEINVRASTVLGYLGAGGVGLYLQVTLSMFRYDRTAVVIIAILIVVVLVDAISNRLREALG